jgi:hypothetical protein|tara:strand:+ start:1745 stop:2599 length:855 start_codon:yes stop_codon:yes gene_type:complete
MGRYYDEKVSLAGLDPANPLFGPLRQAAEDIDRAEDAFFDSRVEVFNQLDFDGFSQKASEVEEKYEDFINVSIYEYKSTFNNINPPRNVATGSIRYVHDEFGFSGITDGYATGFYVVIDDDEDGAVYGTANDVLAYQTGRGKGSIDPLYPGLKAFHTTSTSSTDFYVNEEDEDGGIFKTRFYDVFKGFGEVPYAWQAKGQYSSRQLGVMNAAGNAYEDQVRPLINAYDAALQAYNGAGGGPLVSDLYFSNDPDFPWKDFQGTNTSYNRPEDLPADLIKETRGLT